MSRKSKSLENIGKELRESLEEINVKDIPLELLKGLKITIADEIIDERADISYQPLENVVMIVFTGLLGNSNEWTEIYEFGVMHKEWLSKFLNLENGIPSITTIRTVMSMIEPSQLEQVCVKMIIG